MQPSIRALRSSLRLLQLRYSSPATAPSTRWLSSGPADPAIHAQNPKEDGDQQDSIVTPAVEEQLNQQGPAHRDTTQPPKHTGNKSPPFGSTSPKLQSSEVISPTVDPNFQQKRRAHSALEDVACVGWDGEPLTNDGKQQQKEGKKEKQPQDDNKEYYAEHKPSPLEGLELADTRKPITQATDGSAQDTMAETEVCMADDTVDAALERAHRMFREAAERGDQDMPQSRALRRLLMERTRKESGGRAGVFV